MLKKIGITVACVLLLMVIVVALQPSNFRVARTAQIQAPPEVVFRILNDLHQGERWSPFEKLDPDMKKSFSGPESGTGSSYSWDGDEKAGAGTMTILETKSPELIKVKLDFTRPMEGTSEVRYELTPSEQGTRVNWVMEGENNFLGKVMCLFMDLDGMVGKDFEQGLANLNEVAQKDAQEAASPPKDDAATPAGSGEAAPAP